MNRRIEIARKGSEYDEFHEIMVSDSSYRERGIAYLEVYGGSVNWLSRDEATQLYDALGKLLGKEEKPEPKKVTTSYSINRTARHFTTIEFAERDAELCARSSPQQDYVVYEVTERPLRRYRMVTAEPTMVVEDLE